MKEVKYPEENPFPGSLHLLAKSAIMALGMSQKSQYWYEEEII